MCMEKNIKMSLESARKLWKSANEGHGYGSRDFVLSLLGENFTKEELEGCDGYTWEDSFSGDGYEISQVEDYAPIVGKVSYGGAFDYCKHLFRTENQSLSALAFAQLSHIVAKYNDCRGAPAYEFWVIERIDLELGITKSRVFHHLSFNNFDDCRKSLLTNRKLWEQYWMI